MRIDELERAVKDAERALAAARERRTAANQALTRAMGEVQRAEAELQGAEREIGDAESELKTRERALAARRERARTDLARTGPARPATAARMRPAPSRSGVRKRRDQRALAEAMGELTELLPAEVTAESGGERRTTKLEAGARYRVEPLTQRRRKDRGRTGRLVSWDLDGSAGMLRWDDDGTVSEVRLEDLVRA